jgi:hypothetical protein
VKLLAIKRVAAKSRSDKKGGRKIRPEILPFTWQGAVVGQFPFYCQLLNVVGNIGNLLGGLFAGRMFFCLALLLR